MNRKFFMYRNKGFTLIEILIAMFIFILSALGLTANAYYIMKYQKINEKREEAVIKAQTVMNIIMTSNYNSSCLDGTINSCSDNNSELCCGSLYAGDPNITWNVLEDSYNHTKQIDVTVHFSYQGYEGNVELISLKGEW